MTTGRPISGRVRSTATDLGDAGGREALQQPGEVLFEGREFQVRRGPEVTHRGIRHLLAQRPMAAPQRGPGELVLQQVVARAGDVGEANLGRLGQRPQQGDRARRMTAGTDAGVRALSLPIDDDALK